MLNQKGSRMKKLLVLALSLCLASFAFAINVDKDAVNDALAAHAAGIELTKAQDALMSQWGVGPVIDNAGGPDAFGYIWKDSEEVDGPVYGWIDITGTGTSAIADMSDDITTGPYPIGFGFPHYGAVYTDFYVGSNGAINFDGQYISLGNLAMPTATYLGMIAWFWDDMDPADATDADLLYETMLIGDQNALVISFLNWDEYPGNADPELQEDVTAQMILFEDGAVQVHYQSVELGIDILSSTIGIQDATGTIGLNPLYNGSIVGYPYDNLALEFNNTAVPDANLSGTVTDFDTGFPIDGVSVNVGGNVVITGNDGVYSVTDMYAVTVAVSAMAAGYFNYGPVDVALVSGDNTHDFTMVATPPQTFFTDFEGGPEPFGTDGVAWEFGTPTVEPVGAYSGVNAWSTYLAGDYQNSQNEWLISEPWTVGGPGAFMSYYHWYNYESGWDGYNVNVSTDEGATWTVVTPEGGYPDLTVVGLDGGPGFTMAFDAWEQVIVQLGAYAGQDILIGFRHGTDSSVNTYSGATIDDVAMYDITGWEPDPVTLTLTPIVTGVPEEGGTVVYDANLTSLIGAAMPGLRYRTYATLPNNQVFGPIDDFPFNLTPFMNATVPGMTIDVPAFAPPGGYLLTGVAGVPNNPNLQVTDDFPFSKYGPGITEDFEDGLAQGFVWETTPGFYLIEDGYCKLDLSTNTTTWGSGTYNDSEYDDCTVTSTFEIQDISTSSRGILWRTNGPRDADFAGYGMYISSTSYSVWRYDAGSASNLVGWTTSPDILAGQGAINTLSVSAVGSNFDLYINGNYQGSTTDATYATGYFGLICAYGTLTWYEDIMVQTGGAVAMGTPHIGEPVAGNFDEMGNAVDYEIVTEGSGLFDRSAEILAGQELIEFNLEDWVGNGSFIAGDDADVVAIPSSFTMNKAYPNPFNPSTSVMISLPQASDLTVSVFNVMGQQVATLANGKFNAGQHNFSFDAANVASGLYFIQAQVPGELNAIQKVTLMK
jgi:Immune inhibitor A-like, MAM domain/Secretion system C-terminal sorting domain